MSQAFSIAGAGLVFVLPGLLDINEGPSACAPCSRGDVPGFERWAIRGERRAWSVASTAVLLGLGAATWADRVLRDGDPDTYGVAAGIEATAWALAATELLKAGVARNRPIMYTSEAPRAAVEPDSRRSFPSGHAAAASALATSYLLRASGDAPAMRIATVVAAAGVAAMRVVSARHFPSDVLAGAALGAGAAVAVDFLRF